MARSHGFITRGTEQNLFERGGAGVVDQQGGRLPIDGPAISPAHEGNERGGEVHALCGQAVLVSLRSILVLDLVQDVVVDEPCQPVGEQVASDTKIVVKLTKAMYPTKDVPQDQQCPAVANEIKSGLDRTGTRICGAVDGGRTHSELQL